LWDFVAEGYRGVAVGFVLLAVTVLVVLLAGFRLKLPGGELALTRDNPREAVGAVELSGPQPFKAPTNGVISVHPVVTKEKNPYVQVRVKVRDEASAGEWASEWTGVGSNGMVPVKQGQWVTIDLNGTGNFGDVYAFFQPVSHS
jgi:hypothetical protein